ncbi:MAG: hypothetical protein MZV63_63440 [Marinilabiliales bacterium]|nr:hypothetical protein [Marinilabiliales bacterium]
MCSGTGSGQFTYERNENDCNVCRANKGKLKMIELQTVIIHSRVEISTASQGVQMVECDPINVDPRCQIMEVVHTAQGDHEIWGYYQANPANMHRVVSGGRVEIKDRPAMDFFMNALGGTATTGKRRNGNRPTNP